MALAWHISQARMMVRRILHIQTRFTGLGPMPNPQKTAWMAQALPVPGAPIFGHWSSAIQALLCLPLPALDPPPLAVALSARPGIASPSPLEDPLLQSRQAVSIGPSKKHPTDLLRL